MKTTIIILAGLGLFSLTSCKKDRVCECTSTHIDASGKVNTEAPINTTYKDIKSGDAKTICQKSTVVTVNSSGETSTRINDCNLK